MMRKIFGVKNITHLLYGLILLLPFGMVFGRTIYTIANKNAKDSYYGETINNETKNMLITNNFNLNKIYYLNSTYLDNININPIQVSTTNKLNIEIVDVYQNSNNLDFSNVVSIAFYKNANGNGLYFYGYDSNNNAVFQTIQIVGTNEYFSFRYISGALSTDLLEKGSFIYDITYNNYSFLDNAFEYSLSQFTQDNNLGNVNFFSWFTNLFLDQTNAHNLVYLNFANWYMNYALLVSSGYLLFLCLLWFTNYVRRILDKSMNHDFGGF